MCFFKFRLNLEQVKLAHSPSHHCRRLIQRQIMFRHWLFHQQENFLFRLHLLCTLLESLWVSRFMHVLVVLLLRKTLKYSNKEVSILLWVLLVEFIKWWKMVPSKRTISDYLWWMKQMRCSLEDSNNKFRRFSGSFLEMSRLLCSQQRCQMKFLHWQSISWEIRKRSLLKVKNWLLKVFNNTILQLRRRIGRSKFSLVFTQILTSVKHWFTVTLKRGY